MKVLLLLLALACACGFRLSAPRSPLPGSHRLQASPLATFLSLPLAETTVSEEEILDTVGKASELPDPIFTVSIAVFVLIGVAVLQFSLGDLTKEEGQARVRDFLATKRETERKRGYFD